VEEQWIDCCASIRFPLFFLFHSALKFKTISFFPPCSHRIMKLLPPFHFFLSSSCLLTIATCQVYLTFDFLFWFHFLVIKLRAFFCVLKNILCGMFGDGILLQFRNYFGFTNESSKILEIFSSLYSSQNKNIHMGN